MNTSFDVLALGEVLIEVATHKLTVAEVDGLLYLPGHPREQHLSLRSASAQMVKIRR